MKRYKVWDETIRAVDHEDAACRYLLRYSRRELGTRALVPWTRRDGWDDRGREYYWGQLMRRIPRTRRDNTGGYVEEERLFLAIREVKS